MNAHAVCPRCTASPLLVFFLDCCVSPVGARVVFVVAVVVVAQVTYRKRPCNNRGEVYCTILCCTAPYVPGVYDV